MIEKSGIFLLATHDPIVVKKYCSRKITLSNGEIIEDENKSSPFTDDQLTKILNEKGYPIARRTVAKYREMIGAPVARLRKKL